VICHDINAVAQLAGSRWQRGGASVFGNMEGNSRGDGQKRLTAPRWRVQFFHNGTLKSHFWNRNRRPMQINYNVGYGTVHAKWAAWIWRLVIRLGRRASRPGRLPSGWHRDRSPWLSRSSVLTSFALTRAGAVRIVHWFGSKILAGHGMWFCS
jgi:hypothetical protein